MRRGALIGGALVVCLGCSGEGEVGGEAASKEAMHESISPKARPAALAAPSPARVRKDGVRSGKLTTHQQVNVYVMERTRELVHLPTTHPHFQAELGRIVEGIEAIPGIRDASHGGRAIEFILEVAPEQPRVIQVAREPRR